MSNKFRIGALIALVLAVSGITAASASSPRHGSSHHRGDGKSVQVIHLVSRTDQETPEGTEPPVIGDEFAFSDELLDGDRNVGFLGGAGTVVRVNDDGSITVQLVVTAQLRDGQIATQGLITFTEEGGGQFTLAITGGTGAYRTARGEVFVTETADDDEVMLKIVIIR
jgi:hypothetical protein